MPVPSYRVPVVVARGTIAALTAGLASLEEGEICYATDEDALYVIEGGALTEASGTGAGSLQDVVDDTSPQLGGNLDVNGFEFISTAAGNIVFTPDTTGVVEIKGNTGNDAAIQLNCEANTHGIKLKSPPHSAGASYTLVFPDDTGTTGQALTTDGTGGLSWATPSTVGSIDDLNDVDTTTTAPTDGQALLWDNTAGQWEPGTVAVSNAVDSVNSQTGVVVLDADDIDDTTTTHKFATAAQLTSADNAVQPTDSVSVLSDVNTSGVLNGDVLSYNGTNWVPTSAPPANISSSSINELNDVDTSTVAPTDGQGLVWDNTAGQWEPGTVGGSIQTATDFELQPAAGTTPITRTANTSTSSNVASGQIGLSIQGSGFSYWSTNPDGLSGTVLDYLVNTASFPVDVDISGTTYSITGIQDNSGSGTPNVRLDHTSGISLTNSVSYTLSLASGATTPLADGDFLQWVNADSVFKPVQLTASSSIQTATDFDLQPGTFPYWATKTATIDPPAGEWFENGSNIMRANPVDSNGTDWTTEMTALGTTGTFWYSTDAINWTQTTNTGGQDGLPTWFQFNLAPFNVTTHTGGIYISFSDPASAPGTPLQNNDFLQWVSADSVFKPVQLTAASTRTLLGIGEYVDDAAAGTGGVSSGALYYNTTNSNYVLKT